MQNLKSRAAYTRHVIRGHLQGFEPMSYADFIRFSMFKI